MRDIEASQRSNFIYIKVEKAELLSFTISRILTRDVTSLRFDSIFMPCIKLRVA